MRPKPIDILHIGGIRAVIRRDETDRGSPFNVRFCRLYQDSDGNWKHTSSFCHEDLLELAKLADLAHTSVARFEAEDRKE